ncbi:hypothetical protein [Mycolicibacterium sp. HK-90]|uniref:hypothetical protein n=1 Tax=Mycolicibacterium sp. HK-90 TaxID=3056937 RepID=UPI002659A467|nr:hypothetical protein [Mycolicibacterium sp. HK-90]WKG04225.1 hypothetical protein QU592_03655 [Mycolicibacterium sp. HK-90]
MTGDDDDQGQPPEAPWHHSTPAVLGASVAALVVIGLVLWAAITLTSSSEPEDAPIDFVPPTYASTSAKTSKTTTTRTITTTRPLETTEFGLPGVPDPSGTTSETSGTSGTSTTETTPTTTPTTTEPTLTESETEDDEATTTRNRPRTNVTRTVYPAPVG